MNAFGEYTLRPLGIGEIFDRAVTIYVRNFVAFTLMVLTLLAPLSIAEYFVLPSQVRAWSQMLEKASHTSKTPPMPFTPAQIGWLVLIAGVAVLLAPYVNNAVAVGVASLYNGERPSYVRSFAQVFRRWLPLLGTALLNLLIFLALYVACVIVLVIIVTIGAALMPSALPIAIAFFVIAGAALLMMIPLFLMLLVEYAFSMYATTIESTSPQRAVATAFDRVFGRSEIKKALLMSLAYLGLELGVLTLSGTVGAILAMLVKSDALQMIVTTIANATLTAFLTILLAVYYYDVRTRKEGLDLETDLRRLAAE